MKKLLLLGMFLTSATLASATQAHEPDETDVVFDKAFAAKVHLGMSVDQLIRLVGSRGQKDKNYDGTYNYQWFGGRDSVLSVTVTKGRLSTVDVSTPDGNSISLASPRHEEKDPGESTQVFTRDFGATIKIGTPIAQVITLTGSPGYEVPLPKGQKGRVIHWIGARDSGFTVSLDAHNRVSSWMLLDPKRQGYDLMPDGSIQLGR